MSRRFALPAGALAAGALALAPTGALAAAKSLSVNATPNPDVTGDPVTIYGQLTAAHQGNRQVTLWHRVAGRHRFTPVSHTRTSATGFYAFQKAEGIVRTNRKWFVRSSRVRSATVRERVFAEVRLDNPPDSLAVHHRFHFTGKVTPGRVHRREHVLLQSAVGTNGDRWRTIDQARVRRAGTFVIGHAFGQPGSRTVRVVLPRDRFNLRSASSPVSFDVQGAQNPRFTLGASANPIMEGQAVTLSGKLAGPNASDRAVTLYARDARQGFRAVASTTTDAQGSYSFAQTPLYNTLYQARAGGGRRQSSKVAVGVHDVVSAHPSATATSINGTVVVTGTVVPAKPGHIVYLQRLGDDAAYHTIRVTRLNGASQYAFAHTFTNSGTKTFRVLVPGGAWNLRGLSDPFQVDVAP
jgi:hypothetical protein